ncbi:MAG: heavy-metal-associated domain-containing protein [Bdellovibrionales bacterium]|nr:heavy-metal-associated domain-containing protein [Bdellovibrionales bacterium]
MQQLKVVAWTVGAALALGSSSFAEDAAPVPQTVKATFLITGLHCPPCSKTVEQSLKSIKGVKSAKVDWATKNAKVEFDERQIGAQQIASRIGSTAHMMGGNMRYGGWLALKVPDVGGEGNADKAKAVLSKVKGVSTVAVYVPQKSVGVAFAAEGNVTSVQLVDALKVAGLDASVLP